jgi:hypothetical protein
MKIFLPIAILAALAAGCITDHSSVEPRSVIRMDRTGAAPLTVAPEKQGQPAAPGTQANEPADLGVAPRQTQPAVGATLAETNSLTGVNAPPAATAVPATPAGGASTPTPNSQLLTPNSAATPNSQLLSPNSNPAGSSLGSGTSGTGTGSAIGLPSSTVTGLTNNFLLRTNLFGPRP